MDYTINNRPLGAGYDAAGEPRSLVELKTLFVSGIEPAASSLTISGNVTINGTVSAYNLAGGTTLGPLLASINALDPVSPGTVIVFNPAATSVNAATTASITEYALQVLEAYDGAEARTTLGLGSLATLNDISTFNIADLNNVGSTAPTNGDVLTYNGGTWNAAAPTGGTGGTGFVVVNVPTGTDPTTGAGTTLNLGSTSNKVVIDGTGSNTINFSVCETNFTNIPQTSVANLTTDLGNRPTTTYVNTNFLATSTNFDGLADVAVGGASNGQIVYYNGSNWVNLSPTASPLNLATTGYIANLGYATVSQLGSYLLTSVAATTYLATSTNFDGLADVAVGGASNGQIVYYNGSNWVNLSPTAAPLNLATTGYIAGLGYATVSQLGNYVTTSFAATNYLTTATVLDGLADVTITSPAHNQILVYTTATNSWVNGTNTGGAGTPYFQTVDVPTGTDPVASTGQTTLTLNSTDNKVIINGTGSNSISFSVCETNFTGIPQTSVANLVTDLSNKASTSYVNSNFLATGTIGTTVQAYSNSLNRIGSFGGGAANEDWGKIPYTTNNAGTNTSGWLYLSAGPSYYGRVLRFLDPFAGDPTFQNIVGAPAWGFLNLQELQNVSITSPTTGHVLYYNGSNWANLSPTASPLNLATTGYIANLGYATVSQLGSYLLTSVAATTYLTTATTFDGLADVNTTAASNGQIVYYNGSNWVNLSPTASPLSLATTGYIASLGYVTTGSLGNYLTTATVLNDLANVTVPTPDNGHVLYYTTATNEWRSAKVGFGVNQLPVENMTIGDLKNVDKSTTVSSGPFFPFLEDGSPLVWNGASAIWEADTLSNWVPTHVFPNLSANFVSAGGGTYLYNYRVSSLSAVNLSATNISGTRVVASDLSSINISATNYYNLPSSTAVWRQAQDIVLTVRNETGSTLTIGTPVTISGIQGDVPIVHILSSVNNHVPEAYGFSNHVAGLVQTEIAHNQNGLIVVEGIIESTAGYNFNTSAFAAGDFLYVSSNGQLNNVRPPAPYESHPVGIVLRAHPNAGKILVKIENVSELNDIVGFNLAPSLIDGDLITYDYSTSTFINKQSVGVSGTVKGGTVSATTYQNLPVSSHNQLLNLSANDHPQYVLSSTNSSLSSLVTNHIASAVHWDLSTLNTNYINASGDSASAGFYFSSLSATTISATTYRNLPVSSLSGLADVLVTGVPTTNYVLKWNGTKWAPAVDLDNGLTNAFTIISDGTRTYESAGADTLTVTSVDGTITVTQDSGTPTLDLVVSPGNIQHNSLGSLTVGNPHTQYATLSGAVFTGQVRAPSVSATSGIFINLSGTTVSATNYLNIASGTAIWNASQLQGYNVSSTAPNTGDVLTYDGNGWKPSAPTGGSLGLSLLVSNNLIGF